MANERKTGTNVFAQPRPFIPLLPYQRDDVESEDRFRWNCWSRQTGKSFTKSLRRILRGLKRRRNQIFLSAGERQSRELMQKARQHCEALKIACDYYDDRCFKDTSFKQLEITLPGGVRIIGLPANPQTARGFTGDVFLDEFAMHQDDRDIWAAMFPTLLRGKGELDVASTPKGRNNVFYDLSMNQQFSHSTLTLPDAIEQGLDIEEASVRSAMGDDEMFRQEFLCEFLDEATAFLTYEQIEACQDAGLTPARNVSHLSTCRCDLYMGVDIGRKHDLTVMWVLEQDGDVLRTVGLFELSNVPFAAQFEQLSQLMGLRRMRRCCIDAGGVGMQLAEQLAVAFGEHRVEGVTFTVGLKSSLAVGLRIAVEEGRIRIPCDEAIRRDWHSVERTVSESGHFRLTASRGKFGHAARFWAAALAVHAAEGGVGASEWKAIKPASFARAGAW